MTLVPGWLSAHKSTNQCFWLPIFCQSFPLLGCSILSWCFFLKTPAKRKRRHNGAVSQWECLSPSSTFIQSNWFSSNLYHELYRLLWINQGVCNYIILIKKWVVFWKHPVFPQYNKIKPSIDLTCLICQNALVVVFSQTYHRGAEPQSCS